jgi:molybdopterin converting factor small subunit
MGRGVTHYVATDSMTLGRLLEELGVTDRMDVRVNGAAVEKTYRLADADEVLILPRIRAGSR